MFSKYCEEFPDGKMNLAGENPDCVVTTGNRRFGIEHTRVHHPTEAGGQVPRHQEACWAKIGVRLHDILSLKGHAYIDIRISYDPNSYVGDESVEVITSALRKAVEVLISTRDWDDTIYADRLQRDFQLTEVNSLSVKKFPFEENVNVTVSGSVFVPRLSAEIIQPYVDKKSKRLPDYRKRADEIWLLLVADEEYQCGLFPDFGSTIHLELNGFERIYFMKTHDPKPILMASQNAIR